LIAASTVHLVDRILSVAVYWRVRCIKMLCSFQVRQPGQAARYTHFRQSRVSHEGTTLVDSWARQSLSTF